MNIDYTRDEKFDKYATEIIKDRYMLEGEKSPQDALARAATAFGTNEEHAQRLYDYASKHWFMFATPILANAGSKRGLPASCFLNYIPDSRLGILDHYKENGFLASEGGGIGSYIGALRSDGAKTSRGGRSTGSIPFIHVVDAQMLAFSQGTVRRGAYAAYQDISHPEIVEFILMRRPGGDDNRKSFNLHHAVNITDDFMQIIENCMNDPEADDTWELIDPHTKNVVSTISARYLWELIITTRMETGEPYIHYIDNTNNNIAKVHDILNLSINNSNLCVEILLPTTEDRTAVCVISSLNLEYYDEWKDTTIVEDVVEMLDNVITFFVENAPETMAKAKFAASQERSIGLGTMGFHSYLQKNKVPFESEKAVAINKKIFASISEKAHNRSVTLAQERGMAPDFITAREQFAADDLTVRRNVYTMAVAPNASTSIICGNTSPSVEPFAANAYRQETHNGTNIYKNKYLDKVLRNVLESEDEVKKVWKKIIANKGSVQSLDFLDDKVKSIFKTAQEIDQSWIIKHAADRTPYIDQGQSINLFFNAEEDVEYVHKTHFNAWKLGLKTLYYCRTYVKNRSEDITERFDRQQIRAKISCVGCED